MRIDRASAIVLAAVVLTLGVWLWAGRPADPVLEMTFLDVGEGLCVVVLTPGGRAMVFDCGTSSWREPDAVGEKVAAAYLQSRGINSIDVAVLSHPHADHVSGYARLLECKPVSLVLDLGARHASPYYEALLKAVKERRATYRIATRGQSLDLGEGITAQVLNPDPSVAYSDLNERSVVMRVVYRKVAIILNADAGEEAERVMLGQGDRLDAQVMLVGHHGAATATSPAWLAAVHPRAAIVSCGRGNEYGHPSRAVLDRLKARGVRVYRTDRDGAVTVTTNGRSVRVRSVRSTF